LKNRRAEEALPGERVDIYEVGSGEWLLEGEYGANTVYT
jgi:hypothetical protein